MVIARARNRCEYCQLSQAGQEATFHIDHVMPKAAGGPSVFENLALACVSCSLRKGSRLFAVDPESNLTAAMFHPRRDRWHEHFAWNGVQVLAKTEIGRATIEALALNRPMISAIRAEEMMRGRHPPET